MNAWWWVVMLDASTACSANAGASTEPVQTSTVDMPPSYKFEPRTVEVAAGTAVSWRNSDHFTHSVQVDGGEVKDVRPGASTTITFDRPGTFNYICTYHPQNMKGTVIVTAR